jgi:hypothetical protein
MKAYCNILIFCFKIFVVACQLKVYKQWKKATGHTRTKFGYGARAMVQRCDAS